MKILQINSAKNFGGGEKHLLDLARGLKVAGHTVFFALRRGNRWNTKLNSFDPSDIFLLPLRNACDLPSAWQLAKIIRQNMIEIVHAHTARDYPLAVLAARLAGNSAQVVLTRHVLFPLKSIHKFLLRRVSAVIAVSQAVKNQLTEQRVFPPEKIKCVPNAAGSDGSAAESKRRLGAEFRRQYRIAPNELLVTTVGELKFLKGQSDFLRAAEIVSRKFPNAKFAVVGQDNSREREFKRSLEHFAHRSNLRDKILWLGFVDDLSSVLQATDVFVSPSHTESFGMAILEAMIAAKAIVATKTAGAGELLRNNETGKLVAIQNYREIAAAISDLLKLTSLRTRLGESAAVAARLNFSIDRMISLTENIYFQCRVENMTDRSLTIFGRNLIKYNASSRS